MDILKTYFRFSICLSLVCLLVINSFAQFPGYKPGPGDTLQSVRIAADRKVTLSIYAPKAGEVIVIV